MWPVTCHDAVMAKGHTRWRGTSVEVLVYLGTKDGKGRYVSRTVRWQGGKKATQDAADELLRKLLDEVGATEDTDNPTVSLLIKRWRRQSEPDWSPATTAAYDSYLRNHIEPALGAMKVRRVKPSDIDDFYADLREKGLAPGSIGKVHVILRRAFGEAVRWKWIPANPIREARPPKIAVPELAPPAAGQVGELLTVARAKHHDLYAFLAVAADTGARRGEVCALHWSDVDLEAGTLIIDSSIAIAKGGVVEKDTKTHQNRQVSLGAPAVVALREHRKRMIERALSAGTKLAPGGYVFSADLTCAKPWRPDVVTRRFTRLRNRCGCTKTNPADVCDEPDHQWRYTVRLHDLRHALITDWLRAGVDQRTVMGRVGHSTLQTLTRYAHFVPAADADAAARLGDRHQSG